MWPAPRINDSLLTNAVIKVNSLADLPVFFATTDFFSKGKSSNKVFFRVPLLFIFQNLLFDFHGFVFGQFMDRIRGLTVSQQALFTNSEVRLVKRGLFQILFTRNLKFWNSCQKIPKRNEHFLNICFCSFRKKIFESKPWKPL